MSQRGDVLWEDVVASCEYHLESTEPKLEKLTFQLRHKRINQHETSQRKWSHILQELGAVCEGKG